MELMIDDYLDGRLGDSDRDRFESRMKEDEEFRKKVQTATQSVEILRKALKTVQPGSDFEDKVSSQIISITQSNQMLRPYERKRVSGPLTATDPDAILLGDPDAVRERRRLMMVAGMAAVLFAAAAATILTVLMARPWEEGPKTPPAIEKTE
jgi:anti-sigma factor RsiW